MLKQLIVSSVFLLICATIFSQPVSMWEWASGGGGSTNEWSNAIARDADGNLYITGSFIDSTSFGTNTLTSFGGEDIYVAKLDSDGNWLWAVNAGGSLQDTGLGIVADSDGNCCITGFFNLTATFGALTITCDGTSWSDPFVAKIDSDGNWLWAVRGGGNNLDMGRAISADADGNYYVAGSYNLTAVFGTTTLTNYGSSDIYVAKLDNDGNWLWASGGGGGSLDIPYDIAVDTEGNSYITGQFFYGSYFGSTYLLSPGSCDIVIAKLDTNGNWLWAKRAGGAEPDTGYSIVTDGSGSCYATGTFRGAADFGTTNLTCYGGNDIFITKLDTDGNWQWAVQAGGTGVDYGYGICLDTRGNLIVTGYFYSTATFGTLFLTSVGLSDIFVCGIDVNGGWHWIQQASGNSTEWGRDIVCDNEESCYITGTKISNPTDFGPFSVMSNGGNDVFVAGLQSPALPPLAFPFLEDWSSGSHYTNFWYAESPGWQVCDTLGYPSPAIIFQGNDNLTNYVSSLTSNRFDGFGLTSVKLKYTIDYSYTDWMGGNQLIVEVWNGSIWTPLETYAYYNIPEFHTAVHDISSIVVGDYFKIRFRADGSDSSTFDYWLLDNIRLEEIPTQIDAPQNLTFIRDGDNLVFNWDAVPEADWYGIYFSYDTLGPFNYIGWLDASITHVEGAIDPEMDDRMFFRFTAGAGGYPDRRNNLIPFLQLH